MAQISAPQIIIFFTISLLFTSVVVSWLLLQTFGVSIAGLPFDLPNGESDIDLSAGNLKIDGSDWEYSGTERIATGENSYLTSQSVNHLQGVYTNTYQINNSMQGDYSIVLTRSPIRTQEILVQSDGFHVNEFTGLYGWGVTREIKFYPYQGANQVTSATIKTKFDTNAMLDNTNFDNSVVDFYFNNQELFQVYQNEGGGFNIQTQTITDVFYGGVGSKDNVGLGVGSFSTDSAGSATGVTDFFNFAAVLFKLLTWGIEPQYLPWELNLLLIKTQEFAIGIGIIGLFWK